MCEAARSVAKSSCPCTGVRKTKAERFGTTNYPDLRTACQPKTRRRISSGRVDVKDSDDWTICDCHVAYSLVDVPAMGDARDGDDFGRVVDDVHNAPIPDSDTPSVLETYKLLATGGSGVLGETYNPAIEAVNRASSSASSSFWADRLSSSEYLAMSTATPQPAGPVLPVRDALLTAARLGDEPIPNFFP